MVSRVLVVHLSSLFKETTSMSWDFHYIISVFKLESCTLIKSADKTNDVLSAGPKHISLRANWYPLTKWPEKKKEKKAIFFTFCKILYFVLGKKCTCSVCKLISWEADYVNCAKNKRFCKSQVYMKHHLNKNLKKIVEFSLLGTILLLCYLDYPNSLLI